MQGLKFLPVILSGGVGSRLWPISRELSPKPFIPLDDGYNLLQKTFLRGLSFSNVKEIMTVTNRELFSQTQKAYERINEKNIPVSFVLESEGRNTAPAIVLAALNTCDKFGPNTILFISPADHIIEKEEEFLRVVQEAIQLAQTGKLVTFGIKPTEPATGYGYIQYRGNDVLRFVEKPNADVAFEYIESGDFLWNSGMFAFQAGSILAEMELYCPKLLFQIKKCWEYSVANAKNVKNFIELDESLFKKVPSISIDYAVMEKSKKVAVVPGDIGWKDLGSWLELGSLSPVDVNGNHIRGETVLNDVQNCILRSDKAIVAGLGLKDLIVVNSDDALLIADKSKAQEVKNIFEQLKEQKHVTHVSHSTVDRPWGSYTVLEESEFFKVKRIVVHPQAILSLQSHQHRSEHWVVVQGTATIMNGDKELTLQVNESTFIAVGEKHRLANTAQEELVVIEVQYGGYFGEDDIIRYEDKYGRV